MVRKPHPRRCGAGRSQRVPGKRKNTCKGPEAGKSSLSKSSQRGLIKKEMDEGQSLRSRPGEAPKAEASISYFPLRDCLTIFRVDLISCEMEVINAHGGKRGQQEKT